MGVNSPVWVLRWSQRYNVSSDGRTMLEEECIKYVGDLLIQSKVALSRGRVRTLSNSEQVDGPGSSSTPSKRHAGETESGTSESIDEDTRYVCDINR
jgi:hypothetical protein